MQLTPEQKELGRRNFMKAAATLPVAGAFGYSALNAGPVKAGIIGTGMEGRVLIEAINPKYIDLIGMCDMRPDNKGIGYWQITQKLKLKGMNELKVYDDYHQLLDDPEIEAVIIATPLRLHGPMSIDALKAGKHVMCEKTMAYSIEDCQEMINLAKKNNLNLQIGHMKFYNPNYWDMYRMYNEGMLGSVYHIRTAWHRNTDWNYWKHIEQKYYEKMLKFDPSKIDGPYTFKNNEQLVNWRWYRDTSRGMWTELCSHQIAIANWLFGDKSPKSVLAAGSHSKTEEDLDLLYRTYGEEDKKRLKTYTKDDRDINDHTYGIFEYDDKHIVTHSAIQSNAFDKSYEMIFGTYATIILMSEVESYLFWEPGWDESSAKEAAAGNLHTGVTTTTEPTSGSAISAHATAGEAKGGGGGTGITIMDPYRWELEGFAHTIRTGAPNLCDGVRAGQTAAACFAAQDAVDTQKRVEVAQIIA